MNFTCNECNDSGSRDKLGTYLDCNACGTASMRRDLNDFVKSLGPTHPEDVALAIHQRALAMAPKQEAPAESLPEMTDERIFEWAEGYVFTLKGMPHKMTFSRPRFVAAVRTIIAHLPAPITAPAAANGAPGYAEKASPIAITDSSALNGIKWYVPPPEHLRNGMQLYFVAPQPVAAAGPDAALIEAARNVVTCFNDPHTSLAYVARWVNELSEEIAALSGAKGN